MERIKISEHFYLDEVVCPEIYNKCTGISASFFSERVILGVEKLRRALDKPISINTWAQGGQFKYSGIRPMDCKEGAKWSDHKFGHAADIRIDGIHSFDIQAYLEQNWSEYSPFFTAIEKHTDGWTHVSDRFIPGWDKSKVFWIPIQ